MSDDGRDSPSFASGRRGAPRLGWQVLQHVLVDTVIGVEALSNACGRKNGGADFGMAEVSDSTGHRVSAADPCAYYNARVTGSFYRGRIAPSPTGYLHLGHARTFLIAADRTRQAGGTLVLRNEDLDPERCRAEFFSAMCEDLRWLGIEWREGPDCGGPYTPYSQSGRRECYLAAWKRLRDGGLVYPCTCSRKDLAQAATAPNDSDDEPIYPGKCRGRSDAESFREPAGVNWRFRVPDGEEIAFTDQRLGPQHYVAGREFGDFVIWRRDDVPAYQLAVVADDHAMRITHVVRGADLLKSTARQLLLYRALRLKAPEFYHCDLVRDEAGVRLAKRHDALSIRKLRESGSSPEEVRRRALDER